MPDSGPDETIYLQCGTCKTKIWPYDWMGCCPVCGNGTVREITAKLELAAAMPLAKPEGE